MTCGKRFSKIIIGGTFDRFHAGHQFMIDIACSLGCQVIIGITSPQFLRKVAKKDFADMIQPLETRKEAVEHCLRQKGHQDWVLMPINDKWGKAHELDADALVVTEETYPEGVRINKERKAHNRSPLTLIVIPHVTDEKGTVYTSTRLRQEGDAQRKVEEKTDGSETKTK
ncbi:MAG: pantetheine-phosphate adenylyltransferase [Candidatus Hodarchaeales archaeon]